MVAARGPARSPPPHADMSEPDHVLGLVDDLLRLAQGSAATTIEVESDGLSVKVTRLARGAIGGGGGGSRETGGVGGSAPTRDRGSAPTIGGGSRGRGGVGGSAPTMGAGRTERVHA